MARFELDEHETAVAADPAPAGPDGRHEGLDVRLLQHDIHQLLLLELHFVEGYPLGPFGGGEDCSNIIGRKQSHGHFA